MTPQFGKSRVRREDLRLTRGEGAYAADMTLPGMAHAVMVRCPHAHARILEVDTGAAREVPGVIAVLTGRDAVGNGLADFPFTLNVAGADGYETARTPRPFLASEVVRYSGEAVAVVVAETAHAARDAAEHVAIEYEELPVATKVEDATAEGAPALWEDCPSNVGFRWRHGNIGEVEAALERAHHVTRLESRVTRVVAMPLEPRAAVATVGTDGTHTLHLSHQSPFVMRNLLAKALGIEPAKLRIVVGDVGGSFGMKSSLLREESVVLWAARQVGRPVKWVSDRSETFLADEHGRDVAIEATLGLDEERNFTALRVRYRINAGAYLTNRSASHILNIGGIAGVYRTPLIAAEVEGILTNTQPTAPYRGAGRPDATYAIERAIDVAARECGVDPFELRRQNLIPAEAMPFQTGFLYEYDCGDFARNMARAGEAVDYAGLEVRKAEARRRGRLHGLGIANPIEVAAGPFGNPGADHGRVEAEPDGTVTFVSGTLSTGQGLETVMANLVAESLGIPPERVRYVQGDTARLADGKGSGGSAALAVGGPVAVESVGRLIETGREIVAAHLGVEIDEIGYADGMFLREGSNVSVSLAEAAGLARQRDSDGTATLVGEASFKPPRPTYPSGCHICEVEVDPETGGIEVLNYVAVEDVGRVLNPLLVEGQIHGGVAQGIGQAIKEAVVHDETGQLVTGTFMDYGMPLSSDIPRIRSENVEVPTEVNPLGVKGVGEAGTVGALAATMNAVCDALAPLGVRHLDMPASPHRIWQAIEAARGKDAG